jgi:hypothetical protein
MTISDIDRGIVSPPGATPVQSGSRSIWVSIGRPDHRRQAIRPWGEMGQEGLEEFTQAKMINMANSHPGGGGA